MLIKKITLGADPELFIVDKSRNDKVISAIGIIPGEKGAPYREECWTKGYGIETDNVLAEFNIPPCTEVSEMIDKINFMKNEIRDRVKKINQNYDIQCIASREVDDDQLNDPKALEFGCDADYNVYTQDMNPKPMCDNHNLRSAGCHIHIGYAGFNTRTSLDIVKMLDAFVGVPSVLVDKDTQRRKLYGKAGTFRLQPWGVEYRTLSSFMMSSDELLAKVLSNVYSAIFRYNDYGELPDIINFDKAREIIDNNNAEEARKFCAKYDILTFD